MNFALNYKGTTTNTKGICVMSMDKCYQFSLLDGIDREFEQDKKSVTAYLNNHPKFEKRKNKRRKKCYDIISKNYPNIKHANRDEYTKLAKRYKSALVLTEKGLDVGKKITDKINCVLDEICIDMTEEQRTEFYRGLAIISDSLELCTKGIQKAKKIKSNKA